MAVYFNNLRFFDKTGKPCNFTYDESTDSWSGSLYFPRVSTSLYENQHLFLIESVQSGSGLASTFPVLANQTSPIKEEWRTRWETDESMDQISTYVIVNDTDGNPFIQKYEEVEYVNTAVPYTLSSPDHIKHITTVNSTPFKVNICFTSDQEDIYERTLIIEDMSFSTPRIVAKIDFYGETVGEDERFRLVLENFGRTFNHEDELITANSDIKEPLPNWINTNNKRKELLLTGEEIYPYVGAYKGLINVVKFFGYQDLRIKEYWLNIDSKSENFNKILQYQLTGMFSDEYDPLKRNPLIPNTVYKKTSMFGLFYDITVATGDEDEFEIPTTRNESMFTNEEVLIKLFALKKKLTDEFLPLNAKIVDIVGEGIYFEKFNVKTWNDPLHNFVVNLADRIDFKSNVKLGYIRDIRRFQIKRFASGLDLPIDRFTNAINPYTNGQAYPPDTIDGLIDSINEYYTELSTFPFPYHGEKEDYVGDEPGVLAGCPLILQASVTAFTWDDMSMKWDELSFTVDSSPAPEFSLYTWDTIDFSNYYEIEWKIEKEAPLGYTFTLRGKIQDYYKLPHFLPYSGKYKITLRLYDMFNQTSVQIKEDVIEVMDRQLEIAAFCRFRNFDDYSWDGTTNTWNDLAGSTWHFPIEGISQFDSSINEQLLTWARYKNQEDTQVLNEDTGLYDDLIASNAKNANRVGTRNLNWQSMDLPWDEMYHSTWDMYDFHSEFLGGFRIFNPEYGDSIQIDDYPAFTFVQPSPVVTLTLQAAADQLNASANPGISKFTYVVRFQPNASPTLAFIHAEGKYPGPDSWSFIKYHAVNSPGIYGDKYSFRKPTWLDTIIIDDLAASINQSQIAPISVDKDLMFLEVPIEDLIRQETEPSHTPRPDTLEYWIEKGYKITEPASSNYPYGRRRGHLPSWYGSGSFNSNDLRTFREHFQCPLGTPVFLIHNMSEIPGKTNTRWVVTNTLNGDKIIEIKDKPFLIINFIEESLYTIEAYVTDSNGNESYVKRNGFIDVRSRSTIGRPKSTILA